MSYPLVIANWKMNLPTEGISGWIQNEMLSNNEKVDFDNKSSYFKFIGIAPPISHLSELKNQFNFGFLGAQDISRFDDGSKTGDISADMIIEKGCSFSIIGHSERREFHNETNNFINEKLKICLEKDIMPIVCAGESLEDYNSGKTLDVLETQLKEIFTSISSKKRVVIAYEPVWAIGSGKTPSPDEVNNIHQHIKDIVQSIANIQAINVIYGGSVNCENAKSFFQQINIDGALIGGASLNGKDFLDIYNVFLETL
tara:strand:+ start:1176 stop:1943 length:768 start_codon:yes stop_codon:yes gene_type:complete